MKLLNQSGAVVWSATYDAFGKATVDPASTIVNNLRFLGQYADAETGLHYNWHRYYNPQTGRYTTSDPIGLLGGMNVYTYVEGNPLMYADPLGLVNPWMPNWVKPGILPKPLSEPFHPDKNPHAPSNEPDWTNDPSKDGKNPDYVVRFVWVCKKNSPMACPKKPDPPNMCPKPAPEPKPGPIMTTPNSGCTCTEKELIPMYR
jgi:RHS repeat-associated protein